MSCRARVHRRGLGEGGPERQRLRAVTIEACECQGSVHEDAFGAEAQLLLAEAGA